MALCWKAARSAAPAPRGGEKGKEIRSLKLRPESGEGEKKKGKRGRSSPLFIYGEAKLPASIRQGGRRGRTIVRDISGRGKKRRGNGGSLMHP